MPTERDQPVFERALFEHRRVPSTRLGMPVLKRLAGRLTRGAVRQ
jgi:hypothetical protein